MKTEPPTNYLERSAVMQSETVTAEMREIAATFDQFDAAAKDIERNAILSANLARKLGIYLQTLCGHEQIKFEFWQARCEGKLPFKFESAKMFIGIARKMPRPAETLQEALQFVQTVLIADCALQLPERAETHCASAVNPVARFFNELTLIRQPYQKIMRARPMEQWEKSALSDFLSETQWLADERERAGNLLKKLKPQN